MNDTKTDIENSVDNPLLTIENLSVSVNDSSKAILLAKNINLRVCPGQVIPVTGKSGSGKSTFLRTLILFNSFNDGEIRFKGNSIENIPLPLLRSRMIYLHQSPTFSAGTVKENLYEPYQYKITNKMKPDLDVIINGLEQVGLDADILDKHIDDISGGEAQRVALLRAFLLNPEILLLDEPTSGLDPESTHIIIHRVMKWVTDEKHAAIWVVHDPAVIQHLEVPVFHFTPDGLVENKVEISK